MHVFLILRKKTKDYICISICIFMFTFMYVIIANVSLCVPFRHVMLMHVDDIYYNIIILNYVILNIYMQ